jgi:hypothetical protein
MINYLVGIGIGLLAVWVFYGQIKRMKEGKCTRSNHCDSCNLKENCGRKDKEE